MLAPGNPTGKTTIEGGYILDGRALEIEINGVGGASGSTVKAPYNNSLYEFAINFTSGNGNYVGLWTEAVILLGDFNADGTLDAADYFVWRKNGGGIYTQSDLNIWRANFGTMLGSGTGASVNTTVPEPATAVMLIVAAVGIRLRRRQFA
jgi:hypothetical protein